MYASVKVPGLSEVCHYFEKYVLLSGTSHINLFFSPPVGQDRSGVPLCTTQTSRQFP